MKKIVSLILSVVMILTILPLGALAENNDNATGIGESVQAEVTIGSCEGNPGDEIDIPVSITGNTGFAAFNAGMEYDTNALELLGYEVTGYLLDGAEAATKVAYAHADNDCNSDGILFVAKFKIKDNAPNGTYEIGMICYDWYDVETDDDFPYTVINGHVLVSDAGRFDTDFAVTARGNSTIAVGETTFVSIVLEGKTSATYNAIDMTLTYDASNLAFNEPEMEGLEFDTSTPGTIRIMGYGNDKAVGNILSLPFTGVNPGEYEVTITSAKFDEKTNANIQDAPEATIKNASVSITVSAYTVSLGSGAVGESIALPGQNYTFTLSDTQLYDYDIHVTVGGIDITESVVSENGSYVIPGNLINGNIVISTGKIGKTFSVALNDDNLDGEDHAQYGVDYSFDLTGKNGYTAGVAITIGGVAYHDYGIENSVYTIHGIDITADIVVDVTWEKIETHYTKIIVEGNIAGRVIEDVGFWTLSTDGSNTFVSDFEEAQDFYFTLYRYGLFDLEVSAKKLDGTPVSIEYCATAVNYQGYHIDPSDLKEDIILTVNRVATGECGLTEYVKLDGKKMYLVTVEGKRSKGVYSFDGIKMYWSDVYNAYCYLFISDTALTNEDVAPRIEIATGKATTMSYPMDLNGTNQIDINDAQFVWNMYNAVYDSFNTVSELTFMKADLNGDMKLDILDAQTVIANIK